MSEPEIVTYAVDGRVAIVSLNRADKLNAINLELKRALGGPAAPGRARSVGERGGAPRRGPQLLRRLRHRAGPRQDGPAGTTDAGLARIAHRRRGAGDDARGTCASP